MKNAVGPVLRMSEDVEAIIAAIEDALSEFGVHFVETPLMPDRIVAALKDAGAYEKLGGLP